ncbi:MAG TPA: protocatechuate 4,5-dioxygenase subunit alpha [Trebonia sp.]|jgi:protocatechuate 4,5-dioxygenase alpha subunit|nr:protocatechuate 4,5-dioxygenase subunit alpha [Trebonia sp.]
MTGTPGEYDDIPGTFIFDGRLAAAGYPLNAMLMSLNDPANRELFKADPAGYLERHGVLGEQRAAVLARDWSRMLELGGNIYFLIKLGALDGLTMQDLGASMSGLSTDEFRQMMRDGGRRPAQ